ncbi:MAG: hypothetical protein AAGF88_03715 [Pseudomonadota bacterium]
MAHLGFHNCLPALSVAALGTIISTVQQVAAQQPSSLDFVPPVTAAQLFAAACYSAGSRNAAVATLQSNGFAASQDTGTLFHPTGNLSINAEGNVCSIVFAANGAAAPTAQTFADSLFAQSEPQAAITNIEAEQAPASDGNFYVVASIVVQWKR